MRYFYFAFLFLSCALTVFPQRPLSGVIADSISHKPLPFATIRPDGEQNVVISGINGQFSLTIPADSKSIYVSYINYDSRAIPVGSLKDNDTIFLAPSVSTKNFFSFLLSLS